MELPQCISEVHNLFLYGLYIQTKSKMKLETLGSVATSAQYFYIGNFTKYKIISLSLLRFD